MYAYAFPLPDCKLASVCDATKEWSMYAYHLCLIEVREVVWGLGIVVERKMDSG